MDYLKELENKSIYIRELETTDVAERSGRAQDKENPYTMQKLRSPGYM
jgi:sulfate adenylyltransferase subunit 2